MMPRVDDFIKFSLIHNVVSWLPIIVIIFLPGLYIFQ